jgi:hypothetical protein
MCSQRSQQSSWAVGAVGSLARTYLEHLPAPDPAGHGSCPPPEAGHLLALLVQLGAGHCPEPVNVQSKHTVVVDMLSSEGEQEACKCCQMLPALITGLLTSCSDSARAI